MVEIVDFDARPTAIDGLLLLTMKQVVEDRGTVREFYRESALRDRLTSAGLRVVDRHHAHGLHAPYWWLKCALGVNRSADNPLVKAYHDVLVMEMTSNPLPLQVAERVLQPLIGKSLILYAVKVSS